MTFLFQKFFEFVTYWEIEKKSFPQCAIKKKLYFANFFSKEYLPNFCGRVIVWKYSFVDGKIGCGKQRNPISEDVKRILLFPPFERKTKFAKNYSRLLFFVTLHKTFSRKGLYKRVEDMYWVNPGNITPAAFLSNLGHLCYILELINITKSLSLEYISKCSLIFSKVGAF